MTSEVSTLRRARRSFWILTLMAVAAAGSLSAALYARAGTLTGIRVALSGLVLIATTALAGRALVFLDRARRRPDGHAKSSG